MLVVVSECVELCPFFDDDRRTSFRRGGAWFGEARVFCGMKVCWPSSLLFHDIESKVGNSVVICISSLKVCIATLC